MRMQSFTKQSARLKAPFFCVEENSFEKQGWRCFNNSYSRNFSSKELKHLNIKQIISLIPFSYCLSGSLPYWGNSGSIWIRIYDTSNITSWLMLKLPRRHCCLLIPHLTPIHACFYYRLWFLVCYLALHWYWSNLGGQVKLADVFYYTPQLFVQVFFTTALKCPGLSDSHYRTKKTKAI